MSHHIVKTLRVPLPASKVWGVMNDYGNIANYAPTIQSSSIVGDKITGLGAKRKVTFHHDGSSLIEEIVEYREGQGYKMMMSDVASPMKSMQAELKVEEVGAGASEIHMTVSFELKGGPLGWLLGTLMMKPMMNGVIKKVVSGLAYHSATGKVIDKELPTSEELRAVIGS